MHHKQIFIFIIGLIVISLFSVKLTDAKFSDLDQEQKQFYWKCLKDAGCTSLLKDKKYASYKTCSSNCMNSAAQHSPEQNWCEDSDGTDYFTKGIVKSNLYPEGKEDYGQTFEETTYLIEGICKDNKYMWIQKNCQELEDHQYKDGTCTKEKWIEYWEVKTENKKFEMANSNTSLGSIQGETFRAITSYIGPSELKALASGKLNTGESEYPYNQYLYFDSPSISTSGIVKFATDGHAQTTDFLYYKNGQNMFRYKLEFAAPAESEIIDSTGLPSSTVGLYFKNFENKKITLFGKEYLIVSAKRFFPGEKNSVILTLMAGKIKDTLLEGEEKEFSIGEKKYKVKLLLVDGAMVTFKVNEELVEELTTGGTMQLFDGLYFGVAKVVNQPYAGGVHSATFFLGAEKIKLQDGNIVDGLSGGHLFVNGQTIDGATVTITGSDNDLLVKLNEIQVNITSADDYYIPAGKKLSEIIILESEEPEALFTQNWDVEYTGLTNEGIHDIEVSPLTSSQYTLSWYDGENQKIEMPLVFVKEDKTVSLGKENEGKLVLKEGIPISKEDYFVVTAGSPATGTAKSYYLQYLGASVSNPLEKEIRFKEMGSGETLEYQIEGDSLPTIVLGGYSFNIEVISVDVDDSDILVDLNIAEKSNVAPPVIAWIFEGEEKKYYFDESTYSIQLIYVDYSSAKFKVNGEFTTKLAVGDSYTLEDGSVITIVEILYQSYAGGVHSASFTFQEGPSYLGITNKVVPIIDSYGAKILYEETESSPAQAVFSITTPNPDAYDNQKPSDIKLIIGSTEETKAKLDLQIDGQPHQLITPVGETNTPQGYTSLGGKIIFNTPPNTPQEFIYQYPEKQRLPQVKIIAYGTN